MPGRDAIISTPAYTLISAQGQIISPHLLFTASVHGDSSPCRNDSAIRSSA